MGASFWTAGASEARPRFGNRHRLICAWKFSCGKAPSPLRSAGAVHDALEAAEPILKTGPKIAAASPGRNLTSFWERGVYAASTHAKPNGLVFFTTLPPDTLKRPEGRAPQGRGKRHLTL